MRKRRKYGMTLTPPSWDFKISTISGGGGDVGAPFPTSEINKIWLGYGWDTADMRLIFGMDMAEVWYGWDIAEPGLIYWLRTNRHNTDKLIRSSKVATKSKRVFWLNMILGREKKIWKENELKKGWISYFLNMPIEIFVKRNC